MGLEDLLKMFLGHHGKNHSKHHGHHGHSGHHNDCSEPYYREPEPMQRMKETGQTLQCSYCLAENKITTNFCSNCGKRLKVQCPSCKTKIDERIKYCPKCGLKLDNDKSE